MDKGINNLLVFGSIRPILHDQKLLSRNRNKQICDSEVNRNRKTSWWPYNAFVYLFVVSTSECKHFFFNDQSFLYKKTETKKQTIKIKHGFCPVFYCQNISMTNFLCAAGDVVWLLLVLKYALRHNIIYTAFFFIFFFLCISCI